MSSSLSPVIADLALQNLEKKTMNTLAFHIPFYIHYVVTLQWELQQKKTEILQVFNSFHLRLQFN